MTFKIPIQCLFSTWTQYSPPPEAIDSNFVIDFRKVNFTTPVGPFLCFAINISATPGSLLSLL